MEPPPPRDPSDVTPTARLPAPPPLLETAPVRLAPLVRDLGGEDAGGGELAVAVSQGELVAVLVVLPVGVV